MGSQPAESSQPKIKLYWLNDSRAQSIGWILEELGLEYETEVFYRSPSRFAPPTLTAIHPLGKSPVVTVTPTPPADAAPDAPAPEPVVLAESSFIIEYLCDHFAGQTGLLPERWRPGCEGAVGGETEEWMRFRYLLQYAEGSLMPVMLVALILAQLTSPAIPFLIRPIAGAIAKRVSTAYVYPNARRHIAYLDSLLASSGGDFLCGPRFTAADALLSFPLAHAVGPEHRFDSSGKWEGGSVAAEFPRLAAYVQRIRSRDAFKRAQERGALAEAAAKAGNADPVKAKV